MSYLVIIDKLFPKFRQHIETNGKRNYRAWQTDVWRHFRLRTEIAQIMRRIGLFISYGRLDGKADLQIGIRRH